MAHAQQSDMRAQFYPEPGRSLAERKAQWLWRVVPVVIKACRVQPSGQMSDDEKAVLDKMIANLKF